MTAIKRKIISENKALHEQMWLERPGGRMFLSVYWEPIHDERGKVIGVGSTTVDLTQLKKAEEALRESEQRWATTLSSIGDAVIATDIQGRITFMNQIAVSLTGWKFEDTSGKPVSEIFHIVNEKTREPVENPVDRVLREGAIVGLANHTVLIRKDGMETPIDDSGAPIKDESGKMLGVVLIFRDVTEQRKAERLKDEFIGMVSHELKTPLTITMGALHTAIAKGLSEKDRQDLLHDAISGTETLASIIENLLELSRFQANRLAVVTERIDFSKIAHEVVCELRGKSSKHQLKIDFPENLPSVLVDPIRAKRILFNLVENAIKYSPDGGAVEITAKSEGEHVVFCVSDQGPGIRLEDQSKLFQSFEQLKKTRSSPLEGVGLGLKVCRILLEVHGGRIWLESEPGKGSSFYFTLMTRGEPGRLAS